MHVIYLLNSLFCKRFKTLHGFIIVCQHNNFCFYILKRADSVTDPLYLRKLAEHFSRPFKEIVDIKFWRAPTISDMLSVVPLAPLP